MGHAVIAVVVAWAITTIVCFVWLEILQRKVSKLMADFNELSNDLDAIAAGVGQLSQEIKDLKAQVAAGSPVSQEQLDGLASKAVAIRSAIDNAK
jgi:uncharacterized protein YoxC